MLTHFRASLFLLDSDNALLLKLLKQFQAVNNLAMDSSHRFFSAVSNPIFVLRRKP